MASRPNFGLNELDFVFSTLVVGSILNFVLMYLLAPTLSSSTQRLPAIFANCPASHMFEIGPYTLVNRLGTCVYKGALFAEFLLAKGFPPFLFKTSVVFLRCLNNVLGGMSFVVLARLTGSQSVQETMPAAVEDGSAGIKEKLVNKDE